MKYHIFVGEKLMKYHILGKKTYEIQSYVWRKNLWNAICGGKTYEIPYLWWKNLWNTIFWGKKPMKYNHMFGGKTYEMPFVVEKPMKYHICGGKTYEIPYFWWKNLSNTIFLVKTYQIPYFWWKNLSNTIFGENLSNTIFLVEKPIKYHIFGGKTYELPGPYFWGEHPWIATLLLAVNQNPWLLTHTCRLC